MILSRPISILLTRGGFHSHNFTCKVIIIAVKEPIIIIIDISI